jgi:PhoPQ-activated pathogenicity-related protein
MLCLGSAVLFFFALGVGEARANALDDYVATPDSAYTWSLVNTYDRGTYTDYILSMDSQRWLRDDQVNMPLWHHWIIVTVPDQVDYTTAFLFISGGRYYDAAPTGNSSFLVNMATQTHSVVVQLRQVPNQPMTFTGYHSTEEDGLIAYGWKQFLLNGDPMWLMRLPMTKAAVRAMDTVTAFMASPAGGSKTVDKYVVSGRSKRGWTTWTTAAVDAVTQHRVVGIAPTVIDVLNMEKSMRHHFDAYGYYSPAVEDYTNNSIMDWLDTPEMTALCAIEEPYSYRDRLTMPKLIISSSQDEFFLPDSSQFYYDRLKGEKRLLYVPNVGHSGSGGVYGYTQEFIDGLLSWYSSILNNGTRPEVTWYKRSDGALVIDTHGNIPIQAQLWQASNANGRNFIKDLYGSMYTSSTLTPQSPGHYVASVAAPPTGWAAYYAMFKFDSGRAEPFVFTTEISVVPDVLPYGPQYTAAASTALLDEAFYTEGGSSLVRQAIWPSPSNHGTQVAFCGYRASDNQGGLFVVSPGDPSSCRRIMADVTGKLDKAAVWSPDDSALLIEGHRMAIPAEGELATLQPLTLHGYATEVFATTCMASNNFALASVNDHLAMLPILPNGLEDLSRPPRIVAQLAPLGIFIKHAAISADGSTIAFDSIHSTGGADTGDVYTLRNVAAILAAPVQPSTIVSTLAATTLDDEILFRIRTSESDNFAGMPWLSADGSLVYFSEDYANAYSSSQPLSTYINFDFDVMVSNADGTEADTRINVPGCQTFAAFTRTGARCVCSQAYPDGLRLYTAPLRTTTASFSGNIPVIDYTPPNCLKPYTSDGSATLNLAAGTSPNFTGGTQAISIEAPVAPPDPASIPLTKMPLVRTLGPSDTTFNGGTPTLVFKYTDAEVAGLNEATLTVYRLNTGSGMFEPVGLTGTVRDAAKNTIEIPVTTLGTYGVGDAQTTDSDRDGLTDIEEAALGTNPNNPDTDGDGLKDMAETTRGTNPTVADTDGDGLNDGQEVIIGTNPNNPDTDGDGYNDGTEVGSHSDPNDPQSIPSASMPLHTGAFVLVTAMSLLAISRLRRKEPRQS